MALAIQRITGLENILQFDMSTAIFDDCALPRFPFMSYTAGTVYGERCNVLSGLAKAPNANGPSRNYLIITKLMKELSVWGFLCLQFLHQKDNRTSRCKKRSRLTFSIN